MEAVEELLQVEMMTWTVLLVNKTHHGSSSIATLTKCMPNINNFSKMNNEYH